MWRAPRFWNRRAAGPAAIALAPAGALYGAAVRARWRLAKPVRAGIPVICVGNPGLGGAGKTPTAIAIARRLIALGHAPHFLSRGYGGRLEGPVSVQPERHAAADVGDEPLLLAAVAPTVVSADRVAGARFAERSGAEMIVMDDGYQNPALARDCAVLVVDAAIGTGNGRVFPSGPLREAWTSQLERASALVLIGDGEPGEAAAGDAERAGVPVLRARIVPSADNADLTGRAVIAVSAIARPEKFHASLNAAGARIADWRAFADHHPFSARDVDRLIALAGRHPKALLVTTEKDAVRLDNGNDPGGRLRALSAILRIEVRFDDQAELDRLVQACLLPSANQSALRSVR